VEEGYSANGWLGMLLGVRVGYDFYGTTLTSKEAFEGKMDELCRELGTRATAGKAQQCCDEPTSVKRGHVALSCAKAHLSMVNRIGAALKARGYFISFMAAETSSDEAKMASEVEGAAVFVYGLSQADKDSANCRKMAQYAHQCKVDMVPLKLDADYCADGWLGILLGSTLWFGFFSEMLSQEQEFETKMEELCRELGERGKHT